MTCRICTAKSDAFRQAALIAAGEDYGGTKTYGFSPSPNSRYLAHIFDHKADMHREAAASHPDGFHQGR